MTASTPRYTPEETARRGQEIYERAVRPHLEAAHLGEFAAVDIETGHYELDQDDFTATETLLAQRPDAQIWLVRIGHASTYRIGGPRFAAKGGAV